MKTLKNNRSVIVGIFIFLGIAILVVTIFTLGGQKKTFVKSFHLNAVFNDVGGLLKGANVTFSGVKIGTVKKISFYGTSQVQVTMSIEDDAQVHIRKDAKAKIGSEGLIGNKNIVIYGGTETQPEVAVDGFLTVENILSTDDMLATLQSNNQNLLEITRDFKSISKKIDSGKGLLSSLINDPALTNQLTASINGLQATVANFKTLSSSGIQVVNGLQTFSSKLNQPGYAVNDLVTDTTIYRNIQGTLKQLENSSNTIAQFTASLKITGEKLNQTDNVAGVLLNDRPSAVSMQEVLKNMAAATKKLDEDLEAVQHNFLLRGFFKKKNKVAKERVDTMFIN